MDRGAWKATVHRVAKSRDTTEPLHLHFHGYRNVHVCLCKIVYHGIKTWSIVRTEVKQKEGQKCGQGERESRTVMSPMSHDPNGVRHVGGRTLE